MVPERLRVKHTAHSTEVVPRAVLLHFCMHMVVLKYSYILEKNANLLISSQILSHRYPSHHLVTLAPSPHHSYYPDTSSINILITLFTSSLPHYYPHHLIITLIPHHYPYHLTITSSPHHYLHSGSFSLHKCSQTHHITINIVARSKKKKSLHNSVHPAPNNGNMQYESHASRYAQGSREESIHKVLP